MEGALTNAPLAILRGWSEKGADMDCRDTSLKVRLLFSVPIQLENLSSIDHLDENGTGDLSLMIISIKSKSMSLETHFSKQT